MELHPKGLPMLVDRSITFPAIFLSVLLTRSIPTAAQQTTRSQNDPRPTARAALRQGEVAIDGRMLRARVEQGARAVPLVLQALEARGLAAESVTVSRPSLDDVYLQYTGRSFDEADREVSR